MAGFCPHHLPGYLDTGAPGRGAGQDSFL